MKEEDIRKREVFNRYLELVARDVQELFDFHSMVRENCPACNNDSSVAEFEKLGFQYVTCNHCSTLFVNPRPPFEALKDFYAKSPSSSFWVHDFFKPVAEVRREKIFRPRAEYIRNLLSGKSKLMIGDIGAGFGLFLEELRKFLPDSNYIAIEPSLEMADICKGKGFTVECMCMEDVQGREGEFDLLTAFELLEHLHQPLLFLKKAHSLLKPGGRLLLTTLNGWGFDILLLWEQSKSVGPPHHLNFFNPASALSLMKNAGFEAEEISTPGKLDWDIVEGMRKNEGVDLGRFWNMLTVEGNQACKQELQDWITRNNLSSHMRILARKPVQP